MTSRSGSRPKCCKTISGSLDTGAIHWPFFNATVKGDDRPKGDLGPRYAITYVLENAEGEPMEGHEIVYLEADPPVGLTPSARLRIGIPTR